MLESAFQAEIDALTEQRKALYQQKRAGEDVTSEIESINQELRRLRGQLKTCGQIAADIPRIRAQAEPDAREKIGRAKSVPAEEYQQVYEQISAEMEQEITAIAEEGGEDA